MLILIIFSSKIYKIKWREALFIAKKSSARLFIIPAYYCTMCAFLVPINFLLP